MFVFIDTETGGLTTDYSLLTVAAAIADEQLNVVDTVCFGVKPPLYIVSPDAMRVNKINLSEHAATSMSTERASEEFEHFLQKGMRHNSDKKLIPVGHNISFDLGFVWHQLLPEDIWRQYCTYPAIDTAGLARFFSVMNKIPGFYNLVALRQLFQIETGEAHNAMADVLATVALLKKFVAIANGEQVLG
jgi:DNA polymerase III alpha subunit (gram-positive type)